LHAPVPGIPSASDHPAARSACMSLVTILIIVVVVLLILAIVGRGRL
jgi:hypothetical protein